MDFSPSRPVRRPTENFVPMINVVFLLLIFFLMSAQISAPVPFEVTPPSSSSDAPADGPVELSISAEGALFFNGIEGEAVWDELTGLPEDSNLLIRADSAFSAAELTRILLRLNAEGITSIALVTQGDG